MHLPNSGAAPEFPDTEWKLVLSRLAVNLDTVFSRRYSAEHDPKVTQEMGDFTISTQEVATSKMVESAGDWFITCSHNHLCIPTLRQRMYQIHPQFFAAFLKEHHLTTGPPGSLLTDLAEFGYLHVFSMLQSWTDKTCLFCGREYSYLGHDRNTPRGLEILANLYSNLYLEYIEEIGKSRSA